MRQTLGDQSMYFVIISHLWLEGKIRISLVEGLTLGSTGEHQMIKGARALK
jgi:hypothetical protein